MEARETSDICQQFDMTDIGSRLATSGTRLYIRLVALPTSLKTGRAQLVGFEPSENPTFRAPTGSSSSTTECSLRSLKK